MSVLTLVQEERLIRKANQLPRMIKWYVSNTDGNDLRLSVGFRLLLLLLTSISTTSHEVTVESTKSFKVNAKVPGITQSLAFPP